MKIKANDLKEFFKRSGKIKSAGIIPIYDYLLIECGKESVSITKTNGYTFCKHIAEEDNDTQDKFIIEEKRLSALVANDEGEYIYIERKGGKIVLKDKVNKVLLPDDQKPEHFPKFPDNDHKEKTLLNTEVLAALFEGKNFVLSLEVDTNFSFVYVVKKDGKFYVAATNRNILYLRKINEALPQFAVSSEACSIISAFNHVEYYPAGNYDFFDTGKTVYGFIRTTFKAPDFWPIIGSIEADKTIKVSKEAIASFMKLVNSTSVKKIPIVRFEAQDKALLLSYDESEYNADAEREIEIEKNFWPEVFHLNASFVALILKCFRTDNVFISPNTGNYLFAFTHPEEKGLTVGICPVKY